MAVDCGRQYKLFRNFLNKCLVKSSLMKHFGFSHQPNMSMLSIIHCHSSLMCLSRRQLLTTYQHSWIHQIRGQTDIKFSLEKVLNTVNTLEFVVLCCHPWEWSCKSRWPELSVTCWVHERLQTKVQSGKGKKSLDYGGLTNAILFTQAGVQPSISAHFLWNGSMQIPFQINFGFI